MKYRFRFLIMTVLTLLSLIIFSCTVDPEPSQNKDDDGDNDIEASHTLFTLDQQTQFIENYNQYMTARWQLPQETTLASLGTINQETIDMPPTSYDRLTENYEAGELNEADFNAYAVLAAYQPDALPDDYQGDYPYGLTIQRHIQYIVDHFDQLSSNMQHQLEPYLVPMNDPISIFYTEVKDITEGATTNRFMKVAHAETPAPATVIYQDIFVFDTVIFDIMYRNDSLLDDSMVGYYTDRLNDIKQAIQDAYPRFKSLLSTELTKKVTIELYDIGSDYGDTWLDGTGYRIRLNTRLMNDSKTTKTTVAHELFHDFQFEMGMLGSGTAIDWASEATATWSEHYIYPSYNTEHQRLGTFFATLNKDRVGKGSEFEYSSYMLFYYLTDYGDGASMMKPFLEACTTNSDTKIRGFFDQYYSTFPDLYAEFAKYNLNTGPFRFYNDYGNLPGGPYANVIERKEFSGKETYEDNVSLDSGSLKYYVFNFADVEDAKHINFTFQPLVSDMYKRIAAIQANGNWRFEDWSDLTEKKYCRNSEDESEHVDMVVLIYANADLRDTGSVDVDYIIVETDDCPDEVKITMKGTYTIAGYGNEWKANFEMTDYCEVYEHNMFISKQCHYKLDGEFHSGGILYMVTSGEANAMLIGDVDLYNGFPRVIYPGALGDDETYAQLTEMGFDENVPETGILMTIPYLISDPVGTTTFYYPPPVGTVTEAVVCTMDGITMLGGIILPEDIREGVELTFSREISVIGYDTPIDTMYTMDFSTLMTQMPDLNYSDFDLSDLENLELPEGFEMPEMPDIEDPTQQMLQGLQGIMNPSANGYTAIVTMEVIIEWPEE